MSAPVAPAPLPSIQNNNNNSNNDFNSKHNRNKSGVSAISSNRLQKLPTEQSFGLGDDLLQRKGSVAGEGDDLYAAIEKLVNKMEAHKTIGVAGSISLLVNNCTGGAMVLFPAVYQQNGWLLVTIVMLLVLGLVIICGLLMIEAQAMIPGNGRFQKRVEFTAIMQYYMPGKLYLFWQLILQLSLFFTNVAMIIQSIQVTDTIILAVVGRSCVVPLMSPEFTFACPDPQDSITPFDPNWTYMITLGWWLTCLPLIWMSTVDLEENIIVQDGAVLATIFILVSWIGMLSNNGLDASRLPAIGPLPSAQMIGVVLFNFGVTYSLPSWVNEKQESVPIAKTFSYAGTIVILMYTILGVFGALAFEPFWKTNDTLLTLIYSNIESRLAKITYYMFPAIVNLTTVPVNAVYMRYNLLDMKMCTRFQANIFSAVMPWLVAIPFYTGTGFQLVVTWTGIALNMPINFIVPPVVYIIAVRWQQSGKEMPPLIKEDPAFEAKMQVEEAAKKLGVNLENVIKASEDESVAGNEALEKLLARQRTSAIGRSNTSGGTSERQLNTKPKRPPKPVPPPENPFTMYKEMGPLGRIFWAFTLPARIIFHYTIPHGNLVKDPTRWSPVATFISSCYVGLLSFILVWMATIVADHFSISHFLCGATFVAFAVVLPSLPISIAHTHSRRAAKHAVSLSQDISSTLLALGIPLFLYTVCVHTGSDVVIRYGPIELAFLLKFLLVSLTIIYVQSEQWVLTPSVVPMCLFILFVYYLVLFLVEWTTLSNLFASESC